MHNRADLISAFLRENKLRVSLNLPRFFVFQKSSIGIRLYLVVDGCCSSNFVVVPDQVSYGGLFLAHRISSAMATMYI